MSYSVKGVADVERIAIKINFCKVLSQTTADFQKAALKLLMAKEVLERFVRILAERAEGCMS